MSLPKTADFESGLKRTRLVAMKRLALGLLVGVGVLFLACRLLIHRVPLLEWPQAFAEAAMIGALADWFAVVALFRRPFGLPIPHTAILLERKAEIARTLGGFVSENFLSCEVVASRLERIDLVGLAVGWIGGQAELIARSLCGSIPQILEVFNERDVSEFIHRQLQLYLGSVPLAPLAGRFLRVLTSGGKHEVLLDEGLKIAARMLDENAEHVCSSVEKHVPLPGDVFGLNLRRPVAEYVSRKMVLALQDFLHSAGQDRMHPVRRRFTERVEQLVSDLENSAEYFSRGEELKGELLGNAALKQYAGRVWTEVKDSILRAASTEGGPMEIKMANFLRNLASSLERDPAMVVKLNAWLRGAIAEMAERYRPSFGKLIEETVNGWDAVEMSAKLETEVGADLQFIRINGTLIGGLIGLLIHAVSRMLP